MTEQQIETLKKIMSSTGRAPNSPELDERVLSASKKYAPEKKRFIDKFDLSYQSLNLVGSAALSVLLTTALLFSFSFVLSQGKHSQEQSIVLESSDFEVQIIESIPATSLSSDTPIENVERPITEHARDQLLIGMEPLDINALLDTMEFNHVDERQLAEVAVTEAMSDIRFMVMDGELNSARERYDRLRRSCSICTLPESLEALVLIDTSLPNRS